MQGTLEAVAGVVFGSRELGDGIGRRVRWVHEHIVGPGYTALEPEAIATMPVSDVGRDLAQFILDPTLPLWLHVPVRPLLRAQRLFTLGSLPPRLRGELGFAWSPSDQRRYDRLERLVRGVTRASPRAVRTAGTRVNNRYLLWLAERHVRQFDEKMAVRAVA